MRRFELIEGTSSKFWEVDVDGKDVVVRFGRIGSKGQEKRTSFATEAAARTGAEKLVREKTGKGYSETSGAGPAASAPAPTAKAKAKAPARKAGAAAASWPTRPTPFDEVRCFRAEDDALFARGFPRMHVLTDEHVMPAAAIKRARDALDAIDPRLHVHVPRDVARRFVHGHACRRTWGHGPGAHTHFIPEHIAAREAALESDAPLDASTLERFLELHCPTGREWRTEKDGIPIAATDNETYGWRLHELVWIHEDVLGTEHVARRLVEHLLRAYRDPEAWGFWGQDPWRHNASAHHLAFALAPMRWRLEPKLYAEIVAPFEGLESERLLAFADLLACLQDDARTPKSPLFATELAVHRRDRAKVDEAFAKGDYILWRAEAIWLLGGAPLARIKLSNVRRLPDWCQVRFVDEVGRLEMPEVAVAIALLLSARSGRRAASEWLLAHASFARPILSEAASGLPDEADRERVRAALDVIGGGAPVEARALTEDEVDQEIRTIIGGLEAALVACKGNAKKERAVMQSAFDRYCEARSAGGDVMPEAYFGHQFIDWMPKDKKARERWIDLAVSVQDES